MHDCLFVGGPVDGQRLAVDMQYAQILMPKLEPQRYIIATPIRRTWWERLFSWPWRPWVATKPPLIELPSFENHVYQRQVWMQSGERTIYYVHVK